MRFRDPTRIIALRLAAAIVAGGLGRVLLIHAPPLAEGLFLRLDEPVSLLVTLVLGPMFGLVASFTATAGTPIGSSVPWLVEVVVFWALVRRGWMPAAACVSYWLVVAVVYAAGIAPAPDGVVDVRLAWAKQLLNGALSAVIAQVLSNAPLVRRLLGAAGGTRAVTLRTHITDTMLPLAIVPTLVLGLGLGRLYADYLTATASRELTTRARNVATRIADYIASAEADVATLAGELSARAHSDADTTSVLARHHSGAKAFLTMLVTDAGGTVISTSTTPSLASTSPRPAPGLTVADRDYFREPARTGRPYRSGGFRGRAIGTDPIVALSAPIREPGQHFAGIAQGALNLVAFGVWVAEYIPEAGASVLVLDARGQVIASTGPEVMPLLDDATASPWVQATTHAEVGEYSPDTAVRGGRHIAVRAGVAPLGWQVHVGRARRAVETPLAAFYLVTAALTALCGLVAVPLARRASQRITSPLERLADHVEASARGSVAPAHAPSPDAPIEVGRLQREFGAMVARLADLFGDLERRVEARTAELTSARARVDTILDTASDGMVILDHRGRILEANAAICGLLGYSRGELRARRAHDIEDATRDEMRVRQAAFATTGALRFETSLRAKSGALAPVDVAVTALPLGDGQTFACIRDISERRANELERARLETRLLQAQKLQAIGTLAAGVAHEFNNVLTIIVGNVDRTTASLPSGHAAVPFLEAIGRAADRGAALVRQILTFSRQRDERRHAVALEPVVREAVALLRSTLPAMIAVRAEIAEGLPPVLADPLHIHQVLMNLGGNAGDAMRESGGVLEISVRAAVRSSDGVARQSQVQISVSDTGTGMDRSTLNRIFEPFFTTKPVGAGTGLGMAVAHGVVTSLGGTIDVTSALGQGTTVEIILPAAPDGAAPGPIDLASATSMPRGRGQRILVVDDESEILDIACRQLITLGYEVTGSSSPLQALERVEADDSRYAILVTDLAMPHMDGIELATTIRRRNTAIKIVLCSGYVTDEVRDRAAQAGISAVLAKPFSMRQLAAVVARMLGELPDAGAQPQPR